jgi:hypothetical protein
MKGWDCKNLKVGNTKLRVFELWKEDCKSDGSWGKLSEVSPSFYYYSLELILREIKSQSL